MNNKVKFLDMCESKIPNFDHAILIRMLNYLKINKHYKGDLSIFDEYDTFEKILDSYDIIFENSTIRILDKNTFDSFISVLKRFVANDYLEINDLFIEFDNNYSNSNDEIETGSNSSTTFSNIKSDFLKAYKELDYVKNNIQLKPDFASMSINKNEFDLEYKKLCESKFESLRDDDFITNSGAVELRVLISQMYKLVDDCVNKNTNTKEVYIRDVLFAAGLYDILCNHCSNKFKLSDASNDEFWVYMQFYMLPEIVRNRKIESDDRSEELKGYFFKKRIYFKYMWWFIHSSYNDTFELTVSTLMNPCFSTDTILQMIDRVGGYGYDIDVYRLIIRNINILYSRNMDIEFNPLLRTILKLHVSKISYIEPSFYTGGKVGYVNSLFEDAGVELCLN